MLDETDKYLKCVEQESKQRQTGRKKKGARLRTGIGIGWLISRQHHNGTITCKALKSFLTFKKFINTLSFREKMAVKTVNMRLILLPLAWMATKLITLMKQMRL